MHGALSPIRWTKNDLLGSREASRLWKLKTHRQPTHCQKRWSRIKNLHGWTLNPENGNHKVTLRSNATWTVAEKLKMSEIGGKKVPIDLGTCGNYTGANTKAMETNFQLCRCTYLDRILTDWIFYTDVPVNSGFLEKSFNDQGVLINSRFRSLST